jgi:hypothetical protein
LLSAFGAGREGDKSSSAIVCHLSEHFALKAPSRKMKIWMYWPKFLMGTVAFGAWQLKPMLQCDLVRVRAEGTSITLCKLLPEARANVSWIWGGLT